LREWFHQLPQAKKWGHAAFDTSLASALAGGAGYGIARKLRGHGYELVRNPEGFILDDAYGPRSYRRARAREEVGSSGGADEHRQPRRLGDLGAVGGGQRVRPGMVTVVERSLRLLQRLRSNRPGLLFKLSFRHSSLDRTSAASPLARKTDGEPSPEQIHVRGTGVDE
jgi:hypothetical protein